MGNEIKIEKQEDVFLENQLVMRNVKDVSTSRSDSIILQIKIEQQEGRSGEIESAMKPVKDALTLKNESTILQMAKVVEQENDSSHEPASECSTTWSPIDDDGHQHTGLGFCEIFIKEETHVMDDAEGCSEDLDCSTVKGVPEMWPPTCSTSGHVNATVGNADSISSVDKCTEPTGRKAKLYSCAHCSFKTPWFQTLKRHIRKHTGEKPFSCDICDYKCAHLNTLKSHLRKHSGEKPFSCEFCDYKCTYSSHLKDHLRTHTSEKPFSCEFCDYKCGQSRYLKEHLRTHTGEKPFLCEFCDYKSNHSGNLIKHLIIHTGEKPFSCEFCEYKCSRSGQLKVHLSAKHPVKKIDR